MEDGAPPPLAVSVCLAAWPSLEYKQWLQDFAYSNVIWSPHNTTQTEFARAIGLELQCQHVLDASLDKPEEPCMFELNWLPTADRELVRTASVDIEDVVLKHCRAVVQSWMVGKFDLSEDWHWDGKRDEMPTRVIVHWYDTSKSVWEDRKKKRLLAEEKRARALNGRLLRQKRQLETATNDGELAHLRCLTHARPRGACPPDVYSA